VGIKTYDLKEIPGRRSGSLDSEIRPYLDAINAGKAAGDGVAYPSKQEAARAATRILLRARRLLGKGDTYPGQRIWEDGNAKWFWALVPSRRRSR
jgi:hypothetical protein